MIDCEMSAIFARELMLQRIQSNRSADLYFRDVVQILEKLRLRPDYAFIRAQIQADKEKAKFPSVRPFYDSTLLCGRPKYLRYFDSFGNTPQYFDYQQALACAKQKGKPLFVYFTGHGCATCQRMDDVLADSVVRKMLLANMSLRLFM